MIQPQEIIPLLVAAIIVWAGMGTRLRRDRRPAYRLLVLAFAFLVLGWIASVVEEVAFEELLDAIQHGAGALAAMALAAACWCFVRDATGPER